MDDSLASDQSADQHAGEAVQTSAPAMPVIRQSEKLPYGNPYPLLDGLPPDNRMGVAAARRPVINLRSSTQDQDE